MVANISFIICVIGDIDYLENSTMLLFPSNSSNNAQECINILIVDDNILEPNQTFSVLLNTSDSDVNVQNGRLEIIIVDNDCEFL